jgi:serine/threonine protein kinase
MHTANILVDKDFNLKLCDFGVAKFMSKEKIIQPNSLSTTIAFTAPELLENGGNYTLIY